VAIRHLKNTVKNASYISPAPISILTFDKMQVSKHLDFRHDLLRTITLLILANSATALAESGHAVLLFLNSHRFRLMTNPSNTDTTFAFTRRVNDVFNLLNSDLTVNGIT